MSSGKLRGERTVEMSPEQVGRYLSTELAVRSNPGSPAEIREASATVLQTWNRIAPGLPVSTNVFDAFALVQSLATEPVLPTQEERLEFLQQTHFHMRWAQSGYPTFELTAGLTSALMLTELRGLKGVQLKYPFDTFFVIMPHPSPLIFTDFEGQPVDVKWLYVHKMMVGNQNKDAKGLTDAHDVLRWGMQSQDPAKRIHAIEHARAIPSDPQTFMRLVGTTGLGLYDREFWPADDLPLEQWVENYRAQQLAVPGADKLVEVDRSALRAAHRLVINLCVYIGAIHGGLPRPDNARKPHLLAKRKDKPGPPPGTHWILGREIKLSKQMHEMARAFSERKQMRAAFRMHARFMVRGHWRNQAYGPKHSERRMKWIEPFWKGPDTAEALARLYAVEPEEKHGRQGTGAGAQRGTKAGSGAGVEPAPVGGPEAGGAVGAGGSEAVPATPAQADGQPIPDAQR